MWKREGGKQGGKGFTINFLGGFVLGAVSHNWVEIITFHLIGFL